MKMKEVQDRAKQMGIQPGRMRKAELIRAIQVTEGNQGCFGSDLALGCPYPDCCWQGDCVVERSARAGK